MRYEAFLQAWERALEEAQLLTAGDRPEQWLNQETMSRRYALRAGVYLPQPCEPFLASVQLRFEWDALLTARARTSEQDMLVELLGREESVELATQAPWLRLDIQFAGKLPMGQPAALPGTARWRAWASEVLGGIGAILPTRYEESVDGMDIVRAWLGEPEAHIQCGPSGELLLLGVSLHAWQAIVLPRHIDEEAEAGPLEDDLAALADSLRDAFGHWKAALRRLTPEG